MPAQGGIWQHGNTFGMQLVSMKSLRRQTNVLQLRAGEHGAQEAFRTAISHTIILTFIISHSGGEVPK